MGIAGDGLGIVSQVNKKKSVSVLIRIHKIEDYPIKALQFTTTNDEFSKLLESTLFNNKEISKTFKNVMKLHPKKKTYEYYGHKEEFKIWDKEMEFKPTKDDVYIKLELQTGKINNFNIKISDNAGLNEINEIFKLLSCGEKISKNDKHSFIKFFEMASRTCASVMLRILSKPGTDIPLPNSGKDHYSQW
jgi:hypothetical protein